MTPEVIAILAVGAALAGLQLSQNRSRVIFQIIPQGRAFSPVIESPPMKCSECVR